MLNKDDTLANIDNARILIADDEKSIRTVFHLMLSSRLGQNRIDVAVNGAEAVELFRATPYDVIIMDVNMPIKNGIQAFIEIQELCSESNLKMPAVIFCTGYEPPHLIDDLISKDSRHGLLNKPVTIDTLLEKITSAFKTN